VPPAEAVPAVVLAFPPVCPAPPGSPSALPRPLTPPQASEQSPINPAAANLGYGRKAPKAAIIWRPCSDQPGFVVESSASPENVQRPAQRTLLRLQPKAMFTFAVLAALTRSHVFGQSTTFRGFWESS
jgi:hypothetical protein